MSNLSGVNPLDCSMLRIFTWNYCKKGFSDKIGISHRANSRKSLNSSTVYHEHNEICNSKARYSDHLKSDSFELDSESSSHDSISFSSTGLSLGQPLCWHHCSFPGILITLSIPIWSFHYWISHHPTSDRYFPVVPRNEKSDF